MMESDVPLDESAGSRIEDQSSNVESIQDSEHTVTAADQGELAGQESKEIDAPPNGGYGWVCVAAVFIVNAHTWGLNSV